MWDKIRLQRTFVKQKRETITIEERRRMEEEEIKKLTTTTEIEEEEEVNEERMEEMQQTGNNEKYNSRINREEIDGAIKRSNTKSAPGKDGIDYKIIQKLPGRCIEELEKIFNRIWEGEEMPIQWKETEMIFLEKPGKKAIRPISLTSCMGKIMERVINERLKNWAEKKL